MAFASTTRGYILQKIKIYYADDSYYLYNIIILLI